MGILTILSAISTIKSLLPSSNTTSGLLNVVEKFVDGKASKAELESEENKHALSAEVKLALAQIKLNTTESKHPSIFVAGWRPFVGWVGAIGFAMLAIVFPLLQFFLPEAGTPDLDSNLVLTILGGMLGIGGLRTFEKLKGVNRNNLKDY